MGKAVSSRSAHKCHAGRASKSEELFADPSELTVLYTINNSQALHR